MSTRKVVPETNTQAYSRIKLEEKAASELARIQSQLDRENRSLKRDITKQVSSAAVTMSEQEVLIEKQRELIAEQREVLANFALMHMEYFSNIDLHKRAGESRHLDIIAAKQKLVQVELEAWLVKLKLKRLDLEALKNAHGDSITRSSTEKEMLYTEPISNQPTISSMTNEDMSYQCILTKFPSPFDDQDKQHNILSKTDVEPELIPTLSKMRASDFLMEQSETGNSVSDASSTAEETQEASSTIEAAQQATLDIKDIHSKLHHGPESEAFSQAFILGREIPIVSTVAVPTNSIHSPEHPVPWTDVLGEESLSSLSLAKIRQPQRLVEATAKIDELNRFLREVRSRQGCRELTEAERVGDWSQGIPCDCGNWDLGPPVCSYYHLIQQLGKTFQRHFKYLFRHRSESYVSIIFPR
jgi:hypothetical protein